MGASALKRARSGEQLGLVGVLDKRILLAGYLGTGGRVVNGSRL